MSTSFAIWWTRPWIPGACRGTPGTPGRLILTELTTNAARLDEGKEIHVWVSSQAGHGLLEMAVWDPDPATLPRICPLTEYGESSRGLTLAYELSDRRLGWYRSTTGGGKVVWARVGP